MLSDQPAVSSTPLDSESVEEFERLRKLLEDARKQLGRVVFGQEAVIDDLLTCILGGGHALLVGVPGLAKTRLVHATAQTLGLQSARVQCTPDLMPADILGSEVLEEDESKTRHFRFIPGPVFTQVLMVDEINRASPRTQSALLQAMQEYEISVAGHKHSLPEPFHVLATQNPIEQEGTYPLPEAQLDRFLMQVWVDYPDYDSEKEMLRLTTGTADVQPKEIMNRNDVMDASRLVRRMPVGEQVLNAILKLVRRGRPDETDKPHLRDMIGWPPGPRASQALALSVRAHALLDGRPAPSVDDVTELAKPVLRHRMGLSLAARAEGMRIEDVIAELSADL